jgi:hypothetical protein
MAGIFEVEAVLINEKIMIVISNLEPETVSVGDEIWIQAARE